MRCFSCAGSVRRWGMLPVVMLFLACWSRPATGDTTFFSWQGNFTNNASTSEFAFSLAATSVMRFETFSRRGFPNEAGQPVPPAGFDPRLDLFNSAHVLITGNDDIDLGGGNLDARITQTLGVGNYSLKLADAVSSFTAPHWAVDVVNTSGSVTTMTTPVAAGGSTLKSLDFGGLSSSLLGTPAIFRPNSSVTFSGALTVDGAGLLDITSGAGIGVTVASETVGSRYAYLDLGGGGVALLSPGGAGNARVTQSGGVHLISGDWVVRPGGTNFSTASVTQSAGIASAGTLTLAAGTGNAFYSLSGAASVLSVGTMTVAGKSSNAQSLASAFNQLNGGVTVSGLLTIGGNFLRGRRRVHRRRGDAVGGAD